MSKHPQVGIRKMGWVLCVWGVFWCFF